MKSINRIAVIHDWLTGMRGGEIVLEAILDLFPNADLFTLIHNRGSVSKKIEKHKIVTSFIDRLPFKTNNHRLYLPLFPTAVELFNLHNYDLIISSSHCVARGIIPPPGIPHLCYVHTPMRYVWDMYYEYFPNRGFTNRLIVPFVANYLRMWDVTAAPRVDKYICNSSFVAERIRRYYGRTAAVVHPPCVKDDHKVPTFGKREDFYLIVSAFAPYKRIELAMEAFRDWGRRLLIVGSGQMEKSLRNMKLPNVRFLGNLSRTGIVNLYKSARGLIFPGQEDFGIVPVEAQSFGCPVIAFKKGGSTETIVSNKTGIFFREQSIDSLRDAILKNEKMHYNREDFQNNIKKFTYGKFTSGIKREVRKFL